MNNKKAFIDTNVLVYAHDRSAERNRGIAKELIAGLITNSRGVISTQVLQEFYIVSTTKLGINPDLVKSVIRTLHETLEVVTLPPDLILKGIDTQLDWKLSFRDALILQAAIYSQCNILYTEDLNHSQSYGQVTVVNPFI